MPDYRIKIDVEGAPSGSDRLAREEGTPTKEKQVTKQRTSLATKTEELVGAERLQTAKTIAGGAAVAGGVGLDIYEQNANFRGDSNTVSRIGEIKKWYGRGAVTVGLLATGNIAGAALFIGYTAYNLARENRELVFRAGVDKYKSNFYQSRLINDISKRSR